MASILDMVDDVVTPDVVRHTSTIVGETPAATQDAFRCAVPSILAGALGLALTPAGAERLHSTITEGAYGPGLLHGFGRLLRHDSATTILLSTGERLMAILFGERADRVTDAVAHAGVVSRSAASTVLCLIAAVVMSALGKQMMIRELDARGLGDLLMVERSAILSAAPAGLASQLGLTDVVGAVAGSVGFTASARTPVDRGPARLVLSPWLSRWWPALLAGLAGLALLFIFGRDYGPQLSGTDNPAASVRQSVVLALPGGQQLNVDRGGLLHQLGTYLSDPQSGQPPQSFVFDDFNFESGSARLTPQSERTVDALTTVLEAYPSARVRLEGHTDTTGDAAENKTLSVERAAAVKRMLVAGGVAEDRISLEGYGQERPVAPNDTESGRAQNRRIELVVIQR